MDAESVFYISLILCSPLFFILGQKIVSLLAAIFFPSNLKITATFRDGTSENISANLSDKKELDYLITAIHKNSSSKVKSSKGDELNGTS